MINYEDGYDLMSGKMCLEGDVWEEMNWQHNKWRENDVLEKCK